MADTRERERNVERNKMKTWEMEVGNGERRITIGVSTIYNV